MKKIICMTLAVISLIGTVQPAFAATGTVSDPCDRVETNGAVFGHEWENAKFNIETVNATGGAVHQAYRCDWIDRVFEAARITYPIPDDETITQVRISTFINNWPGVDFTFKASRNGVDFEDVTKLERIEGDEIKSGLKEIIFEGDLSSDLYTHFRVIFPAHFNENGTVVNWVGYLNDVSIQYGEQPPDPAEPEDPVIQVTDECSDLSKLYRHNGNLWSNQSWDPEFFEGDMSRIQPNGQGGEYIMVYHADKGAFLDFKLHIYKFWSVEAEVEFYVSQDDVEYKKLSPDFLQKELTERYYYNTIYSLNGLNNESRYIKIRFPSEWVDDSQAWCWQVAQIEYSFGYLDDHFVSFNGFYSDGIPINSIQNGTVSASFNIEYSTSIAPLKLIMMVYEDNRLAYIQVKSDFTAENAKGRIEDTITIDNCTNTTQLRILLVDSITNLNAYCHEETLKGGLQ